MKIKILLVKVVIVLVVLSGCSKKDKTLKMKITENWEFSQAEKNEWKPAVVPGCVHTDLMMNGIIKDPFYRTNEHDQQWIDKNNWNYRTKFTIDEKILNKDRVKLFFYGLDTYAEVYLNDSYLLSANNMFRHWSADCKDLLKKGE